jgi:L-threonylcarbamoyladenylate synthase
MKIIKIDLKTDFSEAVITANNVLSRGGVIVYPTDTVYGLGANACDFKAVEQIFKIKKRPLSKPLPIVARNIMWVENLAFVPIKLRSVLEKIWPGQVTVILPKREIVPPIVTAGRKNVGLRVPDCDFVDKLLGRFGYPITATSANLSGEEGAGDIDQIKAAFKDELWQPDLIIDAGPLKRNLPSTVLDLSTIRPKILRVGPSKPEVLLKLLAASHNKRQLKKISEVNVNPEEKIA